MLLLDRLLLLLLRNLLLLLLDLLLLLLRGEPPPLAIYICASPLGVRWFRISIHSSFHVFSDPLPLHLVQFSTFQVFEFRISVSDFRFRFSKAVF